MANKKDQILTRISENASRFDSSYEGKFVCPTCLKATPINKPSDISEAHIVPRYVGGSLKTYLCKGCNSFFGSKQDLWFGEYLHLLKSGGSVFATNKQQKTFTLNGVKVTGSFRETKDGALEFITYRNLTSPAANSALDAMASTAEMKVEVKIPIVENTHQVMVGFLTAGYLLWFKELGYSWVFQGHLDKVREQILTPTERIIPTTYLLDAGDIIFEKPWIGFLEIGENSYPCAGISDRIVLFPGLGSNDIYVRLATQEERTMQVEYEAVSISQFHRFPNPTGVSYRNQVLIFPDHFLSGSIESRLLNYRGDGSPPQELTLVKGPHPAFQQAIVVTQLRGEDA